MLIIARRYGRLGNRLLTFAHFIANGIEYQYRVFDPAFDEYAKYFVGTEQQLLALYPGGINVKHKFLKYLFRTIIHKAIYSISYRVMKTLRWMPSTFFHEGIYVKDPQKYEWKRTGYLNFIHKKIVISNAWIFWDDENLYKHAEKIRAYFRPVEKYERTIKYLAEESRKDTDVLIGIHIRHGDYKTFLGGKYYYTLEQYKKVMEQVEQLFGPQKVKFLLVSDDLEVKNYFKGSRYSFSSEIFLEDMYLLAECDYIIGPPSTFSGWAGYYGNKPIYYIYDINKEVALDDFKHVIRFP